MSEQITVTEPSASTAGSRRTTACLRAMRCTPSASVTVMMAGSPSGIAEAASATTIMNISAGGWPSHHVPTANSNPESARITTASTRPK
ncbi:hypothetical protein D9M70_601030 [compost metagenome]